MFDTIVKLIADGMKIYVNKVHLYGDVSAIQSTVYTMKCDGPFESNAFKLN